MPKRGGKSERGFEHDFWSLEHPYLWPRKMAKNWVMVNRAPVVAEVLRFDHDEALTIGRISGTISKIRSTRESWRIYFGAYLRAGYSRIRNRGI